MSNKKNLGIIASIFFLGAGAVYYLALKTDDKQDIIKTAEHSNSEKETLKNVATQTQTNNQENTTTPSDHKKEFDLATLEQIQKSKNPGVLPDLFALGSPKDGYKFATLIGAMEAIAIEAKGEARKQVASHIEGMTKIELEKLKLKAGDQQELRTSDGNVVICLESLGNIADPSSSGFLESVLSMETELIYKSTAIQGLGKIADEKSLSKIDEYINYLNTLDQNLLEVKEAKSLAVATYEAIEASQQFQ